MDLLAYRLIYGFLFGLGSSVIFEHYQPELCTDVSYDFLTIVCWYFKVTGRVFYDFPPVHEIVASRDLFQEPPFSIFRGIFVVRKLTYKTDLNTAKLGEELLNRILQICFCLQKDPLFQGSLISHKSSPMITCRWKFMSQCACHLLPSLIHL